MQTINAEEACLRFADLLTKAEQGETIVIARDGNPVVQMTQITKQPVGRTISRKEGFGMLRGVSAISDDIKTPFAADIEEMFYGNPDKLTT